MTAGTSATTRSPGDPALVLRVAELCALLSDGSSPAVRRARQALWLPADDVAPELVGAGAASLVARGLLAERDGALVAAGPLATLDRVLQRAQRWVEVTVVVPDRVVQAVLVTDLVASVSLERRADGGWRAVPARDDGNVGLAVADLAAAAFAGLSGRPVGVVVGDRGPGGLGTLSVEVDAGQRWTVRGSRDDAPPRAVDPDPTFRFLADALASSP